MRIFLHITPTTYLLLHLLHTCVCIIYIYIIAERSEALNQGSIVMMCIRMYVRMCLSRLGMSR